MTFPTVKSDPWRKRFHGRCLRVSQLPSEAWWKKRVLSALLSIEDLGRRFLIASLTSYRFSSSELRYG